jgi:hypothetical protein
MEESCCCIVAGFIKVSFSIKSPSVASLCPSQDHEKGYICWDVKNRKKNIRLFSDLVNQMLFDIELNSNLINKYFGIKILRDQNFFNN